MMKCRHTIFMLLAVLFAASSFTACGENSTSSSSEPSMTSSAQTETSSDPSSAPVEFSYPMSTDQVLDIWSMYYAPHSSYTSYKESPFHTYLAKATGIEVNWTFPTAGSDGNAALSTMLASHQYPDVLIADRSASATQDLEDEVIIDLTNLLPKYAPNYWALIQSDPEIDNASKTDDGIYYGFRAKRESEWGNTFIGPIIRQDWLTECGLEVPTTIEGWDKTLRTFKEKYNATFVSTLGRMNGSAPAGAFGAYGFANPVLFLDDSGRVQLGQAQPEWKDFMTQMNTWYKDGLIDPDMLTADDNAVKSKAVNQTTGFVVLNLGSIDSLNSQAQDNGLTSDWVGIPNPVDASGKACWTHGNDNLVEYPTASVCTTCEEDKIEMALRWCDYAYSEEGFYTWNFGEEGVSYTMEDGKPVFTDMILNSADGIRAALQQYTANFGTYFGIQSESMVRQRNSEKACAAVDEWLKNSTWRDHNLPNFTFTTEESDQAAALKTALSTHISETALKFLTGERSLDEFDAFVTELKSLGLEEYCKLNQDAVDRYNNR